jgi:hypothetical protein
MFEDLSNPAFMSFIDISRPIVKDSRINPSTLTPILNITKGITNEPNKFLLKISPLYLNKA